MVEIPVTHRQFPRNLLELAFSRLERNLILKA